MNQEIIKLLQAAVECSVFLNPTAPGLSYEELLEVGKRAGFQAGEVGDAAPSAGKQYIGVERIIPDDNIRALWPLFFKEEPDYRNFAAFDCVVEELNARVKADGARNAQLERSLLVERALANGFRATT